MASQPSHFYLVNETYSSYRSWEAWHESFDPVASGDRTGSDSTIGCRFVPLQNVLDPLLRANASAALAAVLEYVPLLGHLVAGGAVAAYDGQGQDVYLRGHAERVSLLHSVSNFAVVRRVTLGYRCFACSV